MTIFASQFDRARVYTGRYTGPPGDTTWRTPPGAAAGGGFQAATMVAALAAGGLVVGLAAAAAFEAFFDGDGGAGPHPDAHPTPLADAADHAHTGADSVQAHDATVAEPAHSGGGDAAGHTNAWGTGWGTGWDQGWDAESSHQLATGGHAAAAAGGTAADHLQGASGQAAHQLFAESAGPESAADGPHGAEPSVAAAHADPAHFHVTGSEGADSGHHDGYDAFAHDGSGYDSSGYEDHHAADQHMLTAHEDTWTHDPGHDSGPTGHEGVS
ncbi:hypothetical protein I6A60_27845 [Frankia sp. AgB1.9]|uniref:hypothetical protein n=1 Tax=unclassified Frankia TaxID=2632575 RepID=UPI001933F4C0|nr:MULTISPECIES: hypothetical protein [unclassified Frankia]MBL7494564.1 hypothetical protein [Frankia sp. AgW1.1]MBL7551644.1 hypothetical protein [Frankia sp. AgB1.9]MBL7624189.1 hypothetical protein [Frankia sp. AgB1.8]